MPVCFTFEVLASSAGHFVSVRIAYIRCNPILRPLAEVFGRSKNMRLDWVILGTNNFVVVNAINHYNFCVGYFGIVFNYCVFLFNEIPNNSIFMGKKSTDLRAFDSTSDLRVRYFNSPLIVLDFV